MSIEVYHFDWDQAGRDYIFDATPEKAAELWAAGLFEHVATVDESQANDLVGYLDFAWHVTNHVNRPWPEYPAATAHVDKPRSSCVGDVMKYGDQFFMVGRVGFVEVPGIIK